MGNSVKTDKEIQLDLGLVGLLSKVGLLGPQQESKSEVRFRVRVMVQELLAFEKIKQMCIWK